MSSWGQSSKVYVGGLGEGADEKEIEEAFTTFGPLEHVWVARQPPGFAFVVFEDWRDAKEAIKCMDGTLMNGRRIRVELSTGECRWSRWKVDPPIEKKGVTIKLRDLLNGSGLNSSRQYKRSRSFSSSSSSFSRKSSRSRSSDWSRNRSRRKGIIYSDQSDELKRRSSSTSSSSSVQSGRFKSSRESSSSSYYSTSKCRSKSRSQSCYRKNRSSGSKRSSLESESYNLDQSLKNKKIREYNTKINLKKNVDNNDQKINSGENFIQFTDENKCLINEESTEKRRKKLKNYFKNKDIDKKDEILNLDDEIKIHSPDVRTKPSFKHDVPKVSPIDKNKSRTNKTKTTQRQQQHSEDNSNICSSSSESETRRIAKVDKYGLKKSVKGETSSSSSSSSSSPVISLSQHQPSLSSSISSISPISSKVYHPNPSAKIMLPSASSSSSSSPTQPPPSSSSCLPETTHALSSLDMFPSSSSSPLKSNLTRDSLISDANGFQGNRESKQLFPWSLRRKWIVERLKVNLTRPVRIGCWRRTRKLKPKVKR